MIAIMIVGCKITVVQHWRCNRTSSIGIKIHGVIKISHCIYHAAGIQGQIDTVCKIAVQRNGVLLQTVVVVGAYKCMKEHTVIADDIACTQRVEVHISHEDATHIEPV